jgi:two-component system, NarL family, nitrate/nitrite response regulator NarL
MDTPEPVTGQPPGAGHGRTITVVIVVDVCLYREGLARSLAQSPGISVLGTAADVGAAQEMIRALQPEVVLLDLATDQEGVLVRRIAEIAPLAKIVALGIREVEQEVLECARAGMAGYVPRDGSMAELVGSIEGAARGELRCSPRIAASLFHRVARLADEQERGSAPPLTPREHEILRLIDQGLSNKQIAHRLRIEVATVKNHVHNLLAKLHTSRRGLAAARVRILPG